MLKIRCFLRKYRAVPVTSVAVVSMSFPAFASDASPAGMTPLLGSFPEVAAWMWAEIGKLLTWVLGQPILLLAMSLFFVGAIVSFFIRVFHSV